MYKVPYAMLDILGGYRLKRDVFGCTPRHQYVEQHKFEKRTLYFHFENVTTLCSNEISFNESVALPLPMGAISHGTELSDLFFLESAVFLTLNFMFVV